MVKSFPLRLQFRFQSNFTNNLVFENENSTMYLHMMGGLYSNSRIPIVRDRQFYEIENLSIIW